MAENFPCDGKPFFIDGPVGPLEALTTCPATATVAATAVILHPHPLYGGTMQNKVVHTLARTFAERGARTVRFNFRGVGQSAGTFADAIGETDDALAVIDWVRERRPGDSLWLAGFSFGAYVALRVAARTPVGLLVTVAPAVTLYDVTTLPTPRIPWLLIQGEADATVPPGPVIAWAERLDPPPAIARLPGVDHFFHRRLHELHARLTDWLAQHRP